MLLKFSVNSALLSFLLLTAACGPSLTGPLMDLMGKREDERKAANLSKIATENEEERRIRCHRDTQGARGLLLERTIRLTRETQRVQRFDCQGQLTSDSTETVVLPRQNIELPELKALLKGKTVTAFNRQTCNHGGYGDGSDLFDIFNFKKVPKLSVNRSNTLMDHEVFDGLNEIDFGFARTACSGPVEKCDISWVATLNLKVDYSESHRNEIAVVKAENCK